MHYTLLVIGDNPEEQLEPYCEQTKDRRYQEFFDAEAKYTQEYNLGKKTIPEWYCSEEIELSKKEHTTLINFGELKLNNYIPERTLLLGIDKKNSNNQKKRVRIRVDKQNSNTYAEVIHFKSDYSENFKNKLLEDIAKNSIKEKEEAYEILAHRISVEKKGIYICDITLKIIDPPRDIPINEYYPSFSKYLEEYHGLEKDELKGKYGYWVNPNAKWDWYVLGGRWADFFTLKDGSTSNQSLKKDIDFEAMILKQRKEAERLWDKSEEVIANAKRDGRDFKSVLLYRYERKDTDTKDSFINSHLGFSVFSVLKYGTWYEKDTNSDSEILWKKELVKLIEDVPRDTLLSLYDCHI